MEVCAALFKYKVNIEAVSYLYGLAGRDFTVDHVYEIFGELDDLIKKGTEVEQYKYIGLRK